MSDEGSYTVLADNGRGLPADARVILAVDDNLEKQISDIKNMIFKFWKLKNPKIIYGGSVNSKNISELNKISSINGFLVGGASQNSKNFIDIIKKTIN